MFYPVVRLSILPLGESNVNKVDLLWMSFLIRKQTSDLKGGPLLLESFKATRLCSRHIKFELGWKDACKACRLSHIMKHVVILNWSFLNYFIGSNPVLFKTKWMLFKRTKNPNSIHLCLKAFCFLYCSLPLWWIDQICWIRLTLILTLYLTISAAAAATCVPSDKHPYITLQRLPWFPNCTAPEEIHADS